MHAARFHLSLHCPACCQLHPYRHLSKGLNFRMSPSDSPSTGGHSTALDSPSHVAEFVRRLDYHFHQAHHNGLSLLNSATYAVQIVNSGSDSGCKSDVRLMSDLNLQCTPTSSDTPHHGCSGSFSSTATDTQRNEHSTNCPSNFPPISPTERIRPFQPEESLDEAHCCRSNSPIASPRQDCLREQMKTLDDDEKLRLFRSEMMAPYLRNKIAALENSVRDIYKSQYVRSNREGASVTELSHEDVYGHTLGCKNYARKCKIKANCCGLFVCCRLCHDEALGEDHEIDRFATQSVLCTICFTEQPVAESCIKCHTTFADYFCSKCRFYENSPGKKVFHCDKCNICRVGEGLGIDTFHCDRCDCCVPMKFKNSHKCVDRSVHANCPICTRHLFTSKDPVEYTTCGHTMHQECFDEYIKTNYQCPLCMKSLVCMDEYFSNIDLFMRQEVLPPEYQRKRSRIFCNDCERKSVTTFHFIYHKCEGPDGCNSYNTRVIDMFDVSEDVCDDCDNCDDNHPRNNFDDAGITENRIVGTEICDDMDIANDNQISGQDLSPLSPRRLHALWDLEDDIGTSECEDEQLWDDEDFMDETAEMAISLAVPPASTNTHAHLFATVGSGG